MKHFKHLVSCVLLLLISLSAAAQMKVTGTVTDSGGEPVIGATVKEMGAGNGIVIVNGKKEVR